MITAPVSSSPAEEDLLRRIASAAHAGAHLIQVRQPGLDALPAMHLVERALRAVEGTAARILVNDRVDVALAAGAHGVHLRSDSMEAIRVRETAPPAFVIGRSVHSAEQARAAERAGGLDYLLFGTVFASHSKPGVSPAGVERLAEACAAVALPVLAIGGITAATCASAAGAGAAGFAAIGLFANGAIEALPQAIAGAIAAFDTFGRPSLT
jgi:thiamine-phosphate pyrophosphorylase